MSIWPNGGGEGRHVRVTGGTAGLALLIQYASGLPFWMLFLIINLPFAVLAVWQRGWSFTIRTVIAIAMVSGWSVVHHALFAIDGLNPIYGTLGGNLLAGVGLLILFRHRASLGGINIIALIVQDRWGFRAGWTQMIFDVIIVAAALLLAYILYATHPDTTARFGTPLVGLTIPFPLYGVLRYLFLVHRREGGGNPSDLLISDKPLLACVALWMMAVVAIVYWGPSGH